jgi:peptide/nickel transport system substrate-binding protein
LDRRTGSIWAGPMTIIEGAPAYVEGRAATVSGIRQIDDVTVSITLADPNSAFFVSGMVTHRPLPILPAHILGTVPPADLARHAFWAKPDVTLGPFVFVRYQADQFLEVRANPNYWGPKPQVDRMILRITPTVDASVAQVERGEVQITNIPALEAERLGRSQNLRILKAPGTGPIRITFDHTKPYFKDRRVRQAFIYAIDREGLVKTVLQGFGLVPAHDILGPAWARTDIKPYPFNPERARALLREAGWDANRRVTLSLIPGFRDRDLAVTIIQQQLRDVGVQVDIRQQDLGTVLRSFVDRSFDMYLYGGGNFRLDPDFVCLLYCSSNFYPGGANLGHFSNDRFDTLAGAGRRLGRTDLRARVYAELSKLIYDEAPNVWLYLADTVYAVNRNVTGFQAHTNYETMFWNGYAWGLGR